MNYIWISIENRDDAAQALREVADLIENGYTNGMIGASGDTWSIESEEEMRASLPF